MFWLKKFVSFWLMPLPLCLLLLVSGLLLSGSQRRSGLGRRLCILAAALLLLFSNRFVSTRLLLPLESQYPAIPEISARQKAPASIADCQFVAVLGSGHSEMPGVSATSRLSASGLARIVEAVRILGLLPRARLIVSGPGDPGHATHAAVLARAAESLGVNPARITLIENARDTEDESVAAARLTAGRRTALVTSAWHMPRAALLFGRAGVDFVPCPADFASRADAEFRWTDLGWDSESLQRSTLAVHEGIGLLWLRIRTN